MANSIQGINKGSRELMEGQMEGEMTVYVMMNNLTLKLIKCIDNLGKDVRVMSQGPNDSTIKIEHQT